MADKTGKCALCGCECALTKHHLVPQVKCHNKYKQIKEDESNLLWICRQCDDQVHALWSENELRDLYNTKEKLLKSESMQKFIVWRQKHPDFNGHSKMSNNRKTR